jgi:hypothetical protein
MDSQDKGTANREYSLNDDMDLVYTNDSPSIPAKKERENLIRTQKI